MPNDRFFQMLGGNDQKAANNQVNEQGDEELECEFKGKQDKNDYDPISLLDGSIGLDDEDSYDVEGLAMDEIHSVNKGQNSLERLQSISQSVQLSNNEDVHQEHQKEDSLKIMNYDGLSLSENLEQEEFLEKKKIVEGSVEPVRDQKSKNNDIQDVNVKKEVQETLKKRKRGRPSFAEIQEIKKMEEKMKIDEERIDNHVNEVQEVDRYNREYDQWYEGLDVESKVIILVCKNTVKNLILSHTSKIYTKEYAQQLMQEYVDDKIDSSNPLFKQLINECVESKIIDPYLKEHTDMILKYIMES